MEQVIQVLLDLKVQLDKVEMVVLAAVVQALTHPLYQVVQEILHQ